MTTFFSITKKKKQKREKRTALTNEWPTKMFFVEFEMIQSTETKCNETKHWTANREYLIFIFSIFIINVYMFIGALKKFFHCRYVDKQIIRMTSICQTKSTAYKMLDQSSETGIIFVLSAWKHYGQKMIYNLRIKAIWFAPLRFHHNRWWQIIYMNEKSCFSFFKTSFPWTRNSLLRKWYFLIDFSTGFVLIYMHGGYDFNLIGSIFWRNHSSLTICNSQVICNNNRYTTKM